MIAASNTAALNGLNGNGLLQQTVLNHQTLTTKDFGSDFGAKWDFGGGNIDNSLTVGGWSTMSVAPTTSPQSRPC